jgi:hypothetical protein
MEIFLRAAARVISTNDRQWFLAIACLEELNLTPKSLGPF